MFSAESHYERAFKFVFSNSFTITPCFHTAQISGFEPDGDVIQELFCVFVCFVSVCVYLQVKVNNEVATGTGPNKKVAKRNAAEAMLLQLGYKASTVPQNSAEV